MKQIGWVVIDTKTNYVMGVWQLDDEAHARKYCTEVNNSLYTPCYEVEACFVDDTE